MDRRNFLTAGATGLAATLAFRGNLLAQLADAPTALPDRALFDKNGYALFATRQEFEKCDELRIGKHVAIANGISHIRGDVRVRTS